MNIGGLFKGFASGGAKGLFGNLFGGGGFGKLFQAGAAAGGGRAGFGLDTFNPIKGQNSAIPLFAGGRGGGGGTGGYKLDYPDPTLLAGGRKGGSGGGTHGHHIPAGQPQTAYA